MKSKIVTFFAGMLMLVSATSASDFMLVSDMSKLHYQISGTRVFFRNLHTFDNTWQGCCYSYYLDISTDLGKVTWSTMLAKIAMKESYYIGVADKTQSQSEVLFTGVW